MKIFVRYIFLFASLVIYITFGQKAKFTFKDAMQFPTIRHQTISEDGKWIGFSLVPERGDPSSVIVSTIDTTKYELQRTIQPIFSYDSKWVALQLLPKAVDTANMKKDKPQKGLLLLNLSTGESTNFEKVKSNVFSYDSRWLGLQFLSERDKDSKEDDKKVNYPPIGSRFLLYDLYTKNSLEFNFVVEFSFDTSSNYLAFSVSEPNHKRNGLYLIDLKGQFEPPRKIDGDSGVFICSLSWNHINKTLSYVKCYKKAFSIVDSCAIVDYRIFTAEKTLLVENSFLDTNWFIPLKNQLKWTEDGKRLFFGIKPKIDTSITKEQITFNDSNFYDISTILKNSNYSLWHWNDPRIKTHQQNWWETNKDRLFQCIYDRQTKKIIQLADLNVTEVLFVENNNYTIGYDENPYLYQSTWEGPGYKDLYLININTGEKKLIQRKVSESAYISPNGKYLVFYHQKNWHLYDPLRDTLVDLTSKMRYPFFNEDWDQPSDPPSYGFAGWFENDAAFLVYDKYDIWKFFTDSYSYICQTVIYGRDLRQSYRIIQLDKTKKFYTNFDTVLLSVFNHELKTQSLYGLNFNILGPYQILEDENNYKILEKAKKGNLILFSKESYNEYPDLWVSDINFKTLKRITYYSEDLLSKYEWGTTEIVRWTNSKGDTLDGFIIKPYNFNPKKKYPLIVYFYERFSHLANNFSFPYIGHRPCFQVYNSDEYIFFLPDIKYTIGIPGYSALDCITSGVNKLLSLGFVDSSAIGIMGHSWSGYQTAFIVTQTNLFSAAVAGASVGNMTSAYSGIRLESGRARQFQYEKTQSRIGGNLWDSLTAYIKNSPIFYAQKMQTPLLLMFGDEDEAVPWQQGIELYLALRRLQKPVFFLQYRNEPHWPKLFANRLDYAIKTKEFFDTFLKKLPPPQWILSGENH